MALSKPQSGDAIRDHLTAETFCTFVDAANAFQDHQNEILRRPMITPPVPGIIKVKNLSGGVRGQFGILGLGDPAIDPGVNLAAFKQQVIFKGLLPDTGSHFGNFCVLLDALPVDRIGRAVVAGAVQVKVNIDETWHQFADVEDTDGTRLISRPLGGAKILWQDSGSGEQWAIVNVGVPIGMLTIKGLTTGAVDSGDATFTIDNVTSYTDQSPVDGAGDTVTVQNTYSDAADDNAVCTATWNPVTELWDCDNIKCPA